MAYKTASGKSVFPGPNALRAGGYIGLLVGGALMFFLPWLLASQLSPKVAPAWGLGNFAFAFCVLGALIGIFVGRRMKF